MYFIGAGVHVLIGFVIVALSFVVKNLDALLVVLWIYFAMLALLGIAAAIWCQRYGQASAE